MTLTTILPIDDNSYAINAMHLKVGGAQTLATGATSATNAAPFAARVIAIYATADSFIQTGDNAVTATTASHFLPAGFFMMLSLRGDTNLAAIRATANGTIYISELN